MPGSIKYNQEPYLGRLLSRHRLEYGFLFTYRAPMKICRICGAVDHNHTTGQVRELLCENCNRGLGIFKDDPNLLHSAINYLQKHWPIEKIMQTPKRGSNV